MSLNVGGLAPVDNSTAVVAMHLEGGGQGDSLKQMVELLAQQVLALQQQSTNQARVFMTEKHAFTQQLYEQAEKTRAVQEQMGRLQTQLVNEQTARQAADKKCAQLNAQVQNLHAKLQQQMTLCSQQQRDLQTKQAHQSDHKDDRTCMETEQKALHQRLHTAMLSAETAKREALKQEKEALFFELSEEHRTSWCNRNIKCLKDLRSRVIDQDEQTRNNPEKMQRYIQIHKELGLTCEFSRWLSKK